MNLRTNPDVQIWRYINLPKFLDLIQTGTLYFSRADFLRKIDKFEGSYSTNYSKRINQFISEGEIELPENYPISKDTYLTVEKKMENYIETVGIKETYINCWHISDFENFAMWKIYSDAFGVSIESTYNKMCDSFIDKWGPYNEGSEIHIGKVFYIDRNRSMIPQGNGFWPFMCKGKEFEYENELRCVIWDHGNGKNENIKVKVDLDKLIQKIHISPFAGGWFKRSIESLCEKYRIDPLKINQSQLT